MTLTMGEHRITSDVTSHYAEVDRPGSTQWRLSWLPGRTFSYNSAISALTAAEALADLPDDRDRRLARTLLGDELQLSQDEWPSI